MQLNTIYNMDCLHGMKLIEDESIDMILCDLPYGTTRNAWDTIIPFEQLWQEYERIIKPNGAIVLTASGLFTAKLILSNEKLYRYSLVWEKTTPTGFLNASKMPLRVHEDICVFYKSPPTYNPQKTYGHERKVSTAKHKANCLNTTNYGEYHASSYDSTERFPVSVITFPTDKQTEYLHPTQKPVALFEWLIMTYTNKGEAVFDSCIGSGTTAVAAYNTDRKYIGMETDTTYFESACKRIEEKQLQLRLEI